MAKALDKAGIVANCNSIPNDPAPPFKPSGLRIGTAAVTTRGFKEAQAEKIGDFIKQVTENIENESALEKIHKEVVELCSRFPLPEYFIKAKK